MNKLLILTLTWQAKDKIEKLYKSLLPALEGLNWTWLIKDNGSNDGTIDLIKSWNNERILPFAYKNNSQNYSQGNNWLFNQYSKVFDIDAGDYLLLLNNDIIFQDTISIKNMIDILDKDNEVGVVGAKLNYEDRPKIIQHAGVLFHPANIGTPYHYRAGKIEEERDCRDRYYPMITGAVLLTRAKLFVEVGALNEDLNWSWDDSEYCMRVSFNNSKIVYCGRTNILHSESASLKKNPINKLFFNQNIKIFVDRWHKQIDKSLVKKYDTNPNFALYSK